MVDYFVDHALKNVWCTPNQDLQSIVKPARLTPFGGVWNKVTVLWREHFLPELGNRFHVYQIGQLHPLLMGLFPSVSKWMTMAEACNTQKMIIDIYASTGIQMPRNQVWYMVTEDKNLIVAVKEQVLIPIDFNNDALYIRVYSNAYFHTAESDPLNDYIEVDGGTALTLDYITAIQKKVIALKLLPGKVTTFVNGYMVPTIDLITAKLDDVIEYVYDSSIYKVIEFNVKSLKTFVSILDSKHKYLLHATNNDLINIDYHDDIDFFIIKKDSTGNFKGVYYHRNNEDAIRMVTHQDYSLPVTYIAGIASNIDGWTNVPDLTIKLVVRKSGYLRPLVNEDSRILELYKLPKSTIADTMLGVNATVTNWLASHLEYAGYTKVMRSNYLDITRELVENAYGYNAISKLLADTPLFTRTVSYQKMVDVPHGLVNRATAYEYDADGILIGWYPHIASNLYVARFTTAVLVEMISGAAGTQIDDTYGANVTVLDAGADYRMYTSPVLNGYPTNKWVDVTGTGAYGIVNNTLTWLTNSSEYYTLVRSNKDILAYSFLTRATDGLIRFSLNQQQLRNGLLTYWVMQIPMGELDIFLNGRSLIEGLDYIVNFPEIVIINKEYLVNPLTANQTVAIRFSGFCNQDMSRDTLRDVGFIEHGLLSNNSKFDIRDDKVLRITVDGKLYNRSELKFSETDSGVTVPLEKNGKPYLIRDIVVPLNGSVISNSYLLRNKSLAIDKAITDYMSIKIPAPVSDVPNVITERYQIFSPFCCKIIYDLKANNIDTARLKLFYNDNDVFTICKPYEYLLKSDPTQEGLMLDGNYVDIHPHNLDTVIDLDIYCYKFITRVVKLYLKDRVNLSHFIRLLP